MDKYGPPCPYRSCGKTWEAGLYPYNPQALIIVAEHNGVSVDALSKGMRYASNPYMAKWMALLGGMKLSGLPYRTETGSLMSNKQAVSVWYDDFAKRFHNTLSGLAR